MDIGALSGEITIDNDFGPTLTALNKGLDDAERSLIKTQQVAETTTQALSKMGEQSAFATIGLGEERDALDKSVVGLRAQTEALSGASRQAGIGAQSVNKFSAETDILRQAALRAGAALTGMFTVNAAIGLARDIGAFASELVALNAETQISMSRLQAWDLIGTKVSVTLPEMTRGAQQLSRRVASGDDSVVGAFDKLGISIDRFEKLESDEQLFALSDAFQNLTDASDRTNVSMSLFGQRLGGKMLRLFSDDLRTSTLDVEKFGPIMNDNMVVMADKFDAAMKIAWKNFRANVVIGISDAIALGTALRDTMGNIGFLQDPTYWEKLGKARAAALAPDGGGAAPWAMPGALPMSMAPTNTELAAQRDLINEIGIAQQKYAGDALAKTAAATETARLAAVAYAEATRGIGESWLGIDKILSTGRILKSLKDISIPMVLSAKKQEELNILVEDAITISDRLGMKVPPEWYRIAAATDMAGIELNSYISGLDKVSDKINDLPTPTNLLLTNAGSRNFGMLAGMNVPTLSPEPVVMRSTLDKWKETGVGLGGAIQTGLINSLQQVPQLLTDVFTHGADLEQAGKAIGATVGGAIGTAIGAYFGGPAGAAIGGAVGASAGSWFAEGFRTDGEDIVRRLGHDMGLALTEEMGNAISQTAHDLFEGDLAVAEIFHLGDLIEEFGADTDNIDVFTRRLRDVFSMLETGAFTTAQATRVVDESFGDLVNLFDGGVISQELREIIQLTQTWGVESKAVEGFLQAQAARAAKGFSGILSGSISRNEAGDMQGDMGQTEFDRLERLAVASFGAVRAAGQPFLETLLSTDDQFGTLNEAADTFGLSQLAAFGDLSALQRFFDGNEQLAGSITGVNDMLTGLANSNLLTQESFSDLGAIAVDQFQAMTANGLTATQALMAQQDALQTLWELSKEGTLVLDDTTQALIDQAMEAGLVGEAHMDAGERATRAMEAAALAMEHVSMALIEAFDLAGTEGETFADRVNTAIDTIPKTVRVDFIGRWSPPEGPGADIQPMAEGGSGVVTKPTMFLAGEAGPESYSFTPLGKGGESSGVTADQFDAFTRKMDAYMRNQAKVIVDELLRAPRR